MGSSNSRSPKRSLTALLALGAVALAVAAAATGASAAPDAVGTVTIVIPSEPRALNSDIDNTSIAIERLVVENLVTVSPATYQPLPGLLTSWKRVNATTWRFAVRKGVRFTNGEKWDANAAAWDINHELTATKGATAPYLAVIASATAVNGSTLEIKTKGSVPYLPNVLEAVQALPPAYFQRVGDITFGHSPVGTGQFMLRAWNVGQQLSLVPNPKFYGRKAKSNVTFTWATEDTTRTNLLETGAADIAIQLPVTARGSSFNIQRVIGTFVIALEFNMHDPPFTDVRVRRAVAKAINRGQLVNAVFSRGLGATPYTNVFNPQFTSAGHHGKKYIRFDPAGATSLIKQADPPAIDFYWPIGQYLLDNQVGLAITGMLQQVGFKVNQHPMEKGSYFNLLLANKMPGMHLLGGGITLGIEQGNLNSKYLSNSVITYCANGKIDPLAAQAGAMPPGKKRDAAYNKIEEILISSNVCPVPLYIAKDVYGVSKHVRGFKAYSSGSWSSLGQVTVTK